MSTKKQILNEFIRSRREENKKRKCLMVVLGCFGDFDSFEYCQGLSSHIDDFQEIGLDLYVIGIGNEASRDKFSDYTNIPRELVYYVNNDEIHRKLGICNGRHLHIGVIPNLLLMCAGINSPGTLKEVIRGYLGDKEAPRIFTDNEVIRICKFISFNSSSFCVFGPNDSLRPLELATYRLRNMIEIFENWKIYVPNMYYLCQRSGTFIFNENEELIYSYLSRSLLGYSETMRDPLTFIQRIVKT